MREHLDGLAQTPKVLLFATDIDDHALTIARAARYPVATLAGVSDGRLARFFTGDARSKVVSKDIRELCVFSSHSVVRDPPFSRIDLVSCRNLLIYLGPEFQSRVVPVFHFALRPGGYLFLGTSESISQYGNLFMPLEKKQRLFQRRDNVVAPVRFPLHPGEHRKGRPHDRRDGAVPAQNLHKMVQARIAERFAPAHVVVNGEGDVLFYSSRTGKYIEAAVGVPDRRLLSMARPDLRPQLRSALREAIETGRAIARGAEVEVDDRRQAVIITVERLGGHDVDGDPSYLVVFSDVGPPSTAVHGAEPRDPKSGDGASTILEGELRETRQRLQTMIEEHASTVDELKSANEELQSLNEEYQSTNEEMETSKEELQSLNEELNTVNAELNAKIEQTDTANADLRNILNSTGIATIFLDRNLVIRNFTPAATGLFNLLPRDHGRPLTDIVARVDDVAHLTGEVRTVLETGKTVRRRIQRSDSSAHYLMHILPYVTETRKVDGALITFVDVSELVEFREPAAHHGRGTQSPGAQHAGGRRLDCDPDPGGGAGAREVRHGLHGADQLHGQGVFADLRAEVGQRDARQDRDDGTRAIPSRRLESHFGCRSAGRVQAPAGAGDGAGISRACHQCRQIWCLVDRRREHFRRLAVE